MFVDLFVRSSPPSVAELTSDGRHQLTLPELVINRRHWHNYSKYLNKIYSDSFSPDTVSGLRDLLWNAMLELDSWEKAVDYKLYKNPNLKVKKETTEKEEEHDGNEERKKTETKLPPTIKELLQKRMTHERLLKEAVKCRQMWMIYSLNLAKDKSMLVSEKEHANEERWKLDDCIDELLDVMYCSGESDSSDDSDTGEGEAYPRKNYIVDDFGRLIPIINEQD